MEENILQNFVNNLLQDRNIRGFSQKWANRMSKLSLTTCKICREMHGKIVDGSILDGQFEKKVNEHKRCVCLYVWMRTKKAGTATNMENNGADWYLLFYNVLLDYYITKDQAEVSGWDSKKGNLSSACPNKIIGGDIYKNKSGKLPSAPNRIWYEADINYDGGYRNRQRILYSSDGLIFVTYDHYQTFFEITA